MKSSHLLKMGFVAVVAASTLGLYRQLEANPQSASPPVHLKRSAGTPLAQRLRGNETEVIVEDDLGGYDEVQPPPGEGIVQWRLQEGLGAFIVEATKAEPHLTPDDAWIRTSVTLVIVDVLKQLKQPLVPGTQVVIEQEGGTVKMGQTKVTASQRGQRGFVIGSRYLVFASENGAGDLSVLPQASYLIVGDRLERLSTRLPSDDLSNFGLAHARSQIAEWNNRQLR